MVNIGICFCVFILISYYGILALCLKTAMPGDEKNYIKFNIKKIAILMSGLIVPIVLLLFWPRQDKFIYYWDYSGYWVASVRRMNTIFSSSSFIALVKQLLVSINYDDYNCFAPSIIALPMKIIGITYEKYVAIVGIFFLIPALLVQFLICVKMAIMLNKEIKFIWIALAFIVIVVFPQNYYSILRGYIDIAILLPISILLYIFLDYSFDSFYIKKDIAISVLFTILWITRRFAIYFIIGYMLAFILKGFFYYIDNKKFYPIIVNVCAIGVCTACIFCLLFFPFVKRALTTNYADIYRAYNYSLRLKIGYLIQGFGFYPLFIIPIAFAISYRKKFFDNIVCALLICVSEILLFWRTQSAGIHHLLIVNVPLLIILIYIVLSPKSKKGLFFSSLVFLISICNFAMTLVPNTQDVLTKGFFSMKYEPYIRTDLKEIKELKDYLNLITEGGNETIYVLASGSILNSSILRNIDLPYSFDAIPAMCSTYDVDLRNGFPEQFLSSEYVVVTEPIQTHLPSGQEVVKYLASEIQNPQSYIGCHFEVVFTRNLDNGVKAKVLKKKDDFLASDKKEMRDYFNSIYPEYRELFYDRIQ